MRTSSLEQLYQTTTQLFGQPNSLSAGLDWIDRVLPLFTQACRRAVTEGDETTLDFWWTWVTGDGVERLRDSGEAEAFLWRRSWLRVLLETTRALRKNEQYRDQDARHQIAESLYQRCLVPFQGFPAAFWHDLVNFLAGTSAPEGSRITPTSVAFPLVLSDPMVIDGDSIDVLMADVVLEPTPYGTGTAYLHPEQVALRCLDSHFMTAIAQAADEAMRLMAPQCLSSVRIRLQPHKPAHEVFLQKLILRGSSVGGAIISGLYALAHPSKSISPNFAVSFALSSAQEPQADGGCHPVGGAYDKVRGCAKAGIRTLLVADEQASQVAFYGHLQNVAILGASTVSDAFAIIDAATPVSKSPSPGSIAEDGGVLPLTSQLYMERKSDIAFHRALAQRPMIVLVKGARQIGKTSLLVRGVDQVRRRETKLVYVDLQSIGQDSLKSQRELFSTLARIFTRELNLDVTMDDIYDERDGPNKNFENFLFKYVLGTSVIWFMDEVDRLFDCDFYMDVFSLMRSWHNRRPVHPELENLTLVLSYATETHLLIEDVYQSPFNVGVKVELEDFTRDQIAELNERVGEVLRSETELERFCQLVGGQPHLVSRGLSWMAYEQKTLDEFAACASLDNGPFGTHLRRLLLVAQNDKQLPVVKEILRGGASKDNDAFLHLRSAGVLLGDDCRHLRLRCGIYEDYLRRHLLQEETDSRSVSPRKATVWQTLGQKLGRRITS